MKATQDTRQRCVAWSHPRCEFTSITGSSPLNTSPSCLVHVAMKDLPTDFHAGPGAWPPQLKIVVGSCWQALRWEQQASAGSLGSSPRWGLSWRPEKEIIRGSNSPCPRGERSRGAEGRVKDVGSLRWSKYWTGRCLCHLLP